MRRYRKIRGRYPSVDNVLESKKMTPDEMEASVKEEIDLLINRIEEEKQKFSETIINSGVRYTLTYYAEGIVRDVFQQEIYKEIKNQLEKEDRPLLPVLEEFVNEQHRQLLSDHDSPKSTSAFDRAVNIAEHTARVKTYAALDRMLSRLRTTYSGGL